MRSGLLSFAAVLLASAPVLAQDVGIDNPNVSTPTTLYFHVLNIQDMPINTQVPDPAFATSQGYGAGTATLRCLHPTTGNIGNSGQGTGGMTSQVFHTAYGYSSPSYVEYDVKSANGQPRTHPERGISYDAIFDPGYPFVLEWYIAVFNGGTQADQVPTPTPGVVVAVAMRAGDAISIDDKAYDSGPTIAAGKTAPATLVPSPVEGVGGAFDATGAAHPQVDSLGVVDGKHLYRFRVPMQYEADRIQRATGFNVRIDMYIDNPYCKEPTDIGKEYVMPSTLAAYSSADHRPLMDLAVMNPIRVEYLHPQFVGEELVVHASLNSVWGNYDVQEADDGIRVTIEGPSPATGLARAAFVQRYHEHYHHQEAVDIAYIWPYKAEAAKDGTYTVFVEFENDQGTAKASATAQFVIGKGSVNQVIGCGGVQEASQEITEECIVSARTETDAVAEVPGFPMTLAVVALAAIAVALRRRMR